MNLCHHRPLFTVTAVFIAAMAIGSALSALWLWIIGGLLLCALCAAILAGVRLWQEHRRPILLSVACLLAAFLACLSCLLTFHGPQTTRVTEHMDKPVSLVGTVVERRGSGGYLTTYALQSETINGRPTTGRLLLTCHYVSDLQPGYRVTLTGTVISLDEAVGDGYDTAALRGNGYIAGLLSESEADVTILEENAGGWPVRIGALRRSLSARLALLCGDLSEGLPSALLLGDRSYLTDTIRRDFARTGVSHILSISGMHMTLLFGILAVLLTALRIPKRLRTVLLMIGAIGYLALVGFIPSATRSVIMLGIVYLAALRAGRADPLTSLGLAGALILAVSPHATYDIGFWLSLISTLGLVAFSPLFRPSHGKAPAGVFKLFAWLKKLAVALLIGLVAMSTSLFLTATAIGEVGLLSPIVTLLFTPATAVLLIASPLALLLANTPLGPLCADICTLTSAWMAQATGQLGNSSRVVVSLRHPAILPIAIAMVVGMAILLILRLPTCRRWLTITPLLTGWVVIAAILGVHAARDADHLHTTYLQPSSQADMLVLVNGHEGVICDFSNGSLTSLSTAMREAEAGGATELSALLLTHYHTATSGTLARMLARETVRALYLPTPTTPDDYYRLLACLEVAADADVPAVVYAADDRLTLLGGATVSVKTAALERSTQPVLLLTVQTADTQLVYGGSAIFESPLADTARAAVAEADIVIFGHHGPLTHAAFGTDMVYRPEVSVILSDEGDEAGYFDPTALPQDASIWLGQRRMILQLP